MTMIEFFKIGSTDLSSKMDYQNYSMNNLPVFQSWTDGNMIEHRNSIRSRITGSFELNYMNASDMTAFLNLMSSEMNVNGYYSVTAYVQNKNAVESFEAFIEYDAETKFDFTNNREYHLIKMNVRQR
jgi:hypothetical protein